MWRLLSIIMALAALFCWRHYQRGRRHQGLQDLVMTLLYERRRRDWQQECDEEHTEDVRMAQYDML